MATGMPQRGWDQNWSGQWHGSTWGVFPSPDGSHANDYDYIQYDSLDRIWPSSIDNDVTEEHRGGWMSDEAWQHSAEHPWQRVFAETNVYYGNTTSERKGRTIQSLGDASALQVTASQLPAETNCLL